MREASPTPILRTKTRGKRIYWEFPPAVVESVQFGNPVVRAILPWRNPMLPLLCYFSVAGTALTWCVRDANAAGCFEVLRPQLHATARDMGAYREWLRYSLPRLIALLTFVVLSGLFASWFLLVNPLGLEALSLRAFSAVMLAGAIGLLSLPHLTAGLRFRKFLCRKAAEFSNLSALRSSDEQFALNFEPANYRTEHGWTAWHPTSSQWEHDPIWTDVVPVVYLRRQPEFSFAIPVDWSHVLAWNLPTSSLIPGQPLPMLGSHASGFTIQSAHVLRNQPNWSAIRVDLEFGPDLDDESSLPASNI